MDLNKLKENYLKIIYYYIYVEGNENKIKKKLKVIISLIIIYNRVTAINWLHFKPVIVGSNPTKDCCVKQLLYSLIGKAPFQTYSVEGLFNSVAECLALN